MGGQRIGQRRHAQQKRKLRLGQRLLGLQHHRKRQKPRRLVQDERPRAFLRRKAHGLGQHVAPVRPVQREGGRQVQPGPLRCLRRVHRHPRASQDRYSSRTDRSRPIRR
jgi:hypothetical protein